uniref:peptidylprolyl isomerase n=1 Tax=Lotharella globosa TaxID=91324 RepID=A0A7S3YYQ0_9EUKA
MTETKGAEASCMKKKRGSKSSDDVHDEGLHRNDTSPKSDDPSLEQSRLDPPSVSSPDRKNNTSPKSDDPSLKQSTPSVPAPSPDRKKNAKGANLSPPSPRKETKSKPSGANHNLPVVEFKTTLGSFEAEFFADKMPYTCASMLDLVRTGFYDGQHFHYAFEGYLIQFGCPHSKDPRSERVGSGAAPANSTFLGFDGKTYQRSPDGCIRGEQKAEGLSNKPMYISMSNAYTPDSGGSQFFINTAHNAHLDANYHVVFAKVSKGEEVVRKIESTQTDKKCAPLVPVKMISATVKRGFSGMANDAKADAKRWNLKRVFDCYSDSRGRMNESAFVKAVGHDASGYFASLGPDGNGCIAFEKFAPFSLGFWAGFVSWQRQPESMDTLYFAREDMRQKYHTRNHTQSHASCLTVVILSIEYALTCFRISTEDTPLGIVERLMLAYGVSAALVCSMAQMVEWNEKEKRKYRNKRLGDHKKMGEKKHSPQKTVKKDLVVDGKAQCTREEKGPLHSSQLQQSLPKGGASEKDSSAPQSQKPPMPSATTPEQPSGDTKDSAIASHGLKDPADLTTPFVLVNHPDTWKCSSCFAHNDNATNECSECHLPRVHVQEAIEHQQCKDNGVGDYTGAYEDEDEDEDEDELMIQIEKEHEAQEAKNAIEEQAEGEDGSLLCDECYRAQQHQELREQGLVVLPNLYCYPTVTM